jgi:hypothetical protein
MTLRRGKITFDRGTDRLFEHVDQFIIQEAVFALGALWSSKTLGHGFDPDDVATIDSFVFNLSLDIPLARVIEDAFEERRPNSRSLVVQSGTKANAMPDSAPFSQGFNSVSWLPITPIFVDFFERHRPWIEGRYPKHKLWPATFDFARLIRNAVSHGGKLHYLHDPERVSVWHHLEFDYSDNGKQIVGAGGVLSPADMFFLMLDTSDELDALACPLTPA